LRLSLYRTVRGRLAGLLVRVSDDCGAVLQRVVPDTRLRGHRLDALPVRRVPGTPLAGPRGGQIVRTPERRCDALHLLVHAERAEDLASALQIGARLVGSARGLPEQPIRMIDPGFVDRRALERAAQGDRL